MNRLIIVLIAYFVMCAGAFSAPIKAMILDGQNNHDWKATTPVLKKQLLDAKKFVVDVVTSPGEDESLADFNPKFSKYDVVVLNYNGKLWNKNTRENFVDYVQSGGRVVVVHAANNPFAKWEEYNEIIGIGGWGGRNKRSGPYCYVVDGKLVHDHESDGPGGGHEGYGEFVVINRQPNHPVLKGMPEQWLQPDELYNFLRGPGKNMEVLATAYSASPRDKGGSGRHEPMIMTLSYGKGVIFHTTLGHNVGSMKSKGFQAIFTRGTEWAATGKVTIPLPRRIPKVQSAAEALGDLSELDSYVAFDAVLTEIGQAAGNAVELKKIESILIKHLKNSKTSFLGLQATCNALGVAGTQRAVPALATLLAKDAKHASIAAIALETIGGAKATEALHAELTKRRGFNEVRIIHALGARRDVASVDILFSLCTDEDAAVRNAAIKALSSIASTKALANLNALPDSDAKIRSILNCAYTLFEEGEEKVAATVFTQLHNDPKLPVSLRTAVLRGMLMADPKSGMELVWTLLEDETSSAAAMNVLASVPGSKALADDIVGHFDGLSHSAQLSLVTILGEMGEASALSKVLSIAQSSNGALKGASIKSLGQLPGNKASVRYLVGEAVSTNSEFSAAAHTALVTTPGKTAIELIADGIRHEGPFQSTFIQVAADRNMVMVNPDLLNVAKSSKAAIQVDAYDALSVLAGEEEYSTLINHALNSQGEVQSAAVNAVIHAGRKIQNDKKRLTPLETQLSKSLKDNQRIALLPVLTDIGGADVLSLVDEHARHKSNYVQQAAFRELGRWKSAEAIDTILALADEIKDSSIRRQLMVAFSGLLSESKNVPDEKKIVQYRKALSIGLDVDGKRALLKSLSNVKDGGALELVNELAKEPELTIDAKRAALTIKQKLMTAPTLSASHGSKEITHAMDDNQETRWSTGTSMKPGMWFRIDLHMESDIYGFTLDTKRSKGDYPRGYEVYVSSSIDEKGALVASGNEKNPVTEVEFKKPVRGRYIKIVQTGSDGLWWSIHELSVVHDPGLEKIPAPQVPLEQLLGGDGMIDTWNVAGPYMKSGVEGASLYTTKFAPEMDVRMASWSLLDKDEVHQGVVNFGPLFGGDQRVAYLNSTIVAEKDTEVTLALGSDDAFIAWVNGKNVLSKNATRPLSKDSEKVTIRLNKGDNDVLVKIVNYGGNWAGCARIIK